MSDFSDITSLSLGNTFGAWYNKTNEIITRINTLDVGSMTGGDGIIVSKHPSIAGGYTLDFSGAVTRNTTFNGDVNILGTLSYGALNADNTTTQITLPYAPGVTNGSIVYLDAKGLLQKAQANDECTSEVVGVVTGITGTNAIVATTGKVSGVSLAHLLTGVPGATFVKGAVYFLSAGVSGAGVTAEPNISQYISKPVVLGLTSDTALILPYRAFIANSGISGINSIAGLTSGVLSVNGLTAAVYTSSVDPSTGLTNTVLRTTGHVHAVTTMNNCTGLVTASLAEIGINDQLRELTNTYVGTDVSLSVGSVRTSVSKIKVGSALYNLFGTLGGGTADVSDVYKLHQIRIIPINIPTAVQAIPFSLYRVYHRYGATDYVETSSLTTGAGQAAGEQHLEFRMKNYDIVVDDLGTKTTVTKTPTNYLLKPIFKPVKGDGITSGDANGNLDSSAPYPIIYGPAAWTSYTFYKEGAYAGLNRPYAWSFNAEIFSSKQITEYIRTSVTGVTGDLSGTTFGITMDSNVLGWNANYGATPESIAIYFPSFETYLESTTSPERIDLQVILEMYPYNPLTGVTGSIFRIPVQCSTQSIKYTVSGTNRTLAGPQ